jgi:hypothetical protein
VSYPVLDPRLASVPRSLERLGLEPRSTHTNLQDSEWRLAWQQIERDIGPSSSPPSASNLPSTQTFTGRENALAIEELENQANNYQRRQAIQARREALPQGQRPTTHNAEERGYSGDPSAVGFLQRARLVQMAQNAQNTALDTSQVSTPTRSSGQPGTQSGSQTHATSRPSSLVSPLSSYTTSTTSSYTEPSVDGDTEVPRSPSSERQDRMLDHSPRHRCRKCGKAHHNLSDLKKHDKNVHTPYQLRRFRCPECTLRFVWNNHMQRHIEDVHRPRPAVQCPNCGDNFSRQSNMNRHLQSCTGVVSASRRGRPRRNPANTRSPTPSGYDLPLQQMDNRELQTPQHPASDDIFMEVEYQDDFDHYPPSPTPFPRSYGFQR